MRRTSIAMLVCTALGVVGLAIAAVTTTTTRAFTIGVFSTIPSGAITAGQTACQKPITVPHGGAFDSVDLEVGTYFRKHGPPLDVTVRGMDGTHLERRGVLPAGYPDVGEQQRHVVEVGHVPDGSTISVCVHNEGPFKVALFGGYDASATESTGLVDGHPIDFDFDFVFRRKAQSFATLLPTIARRASLFRPPWVAPGVYYILVILVLLAIPLLLGRAVRDLDRND